MVSDPGSSRFSSHLHSRHVYWTVCRQTHTGSVICQNVWDCD